MVLILCGAEFLEAIPLVQIMSIIITIGGMNYILGIVGLINLDKAKFFTYSVFIAGALSVLTLLLTASTYGINAGAWAMMIAETVLPSMMFRVM